MAGYFTGYLDSGRPSGRLANRRRATYIEHMAQPASARPVPAQVSARKADERSRDRSTKPHNETVEERRARLDAIFAKVVESNRDFLIALSKR